MASVVLRDLLVTVMCAVLHVVTFVARLSILFWMSTDAIESLTQVVCKAFGGRFSTAGHSGMTTVTTIDV